MSDTESRHRAQLFLQRGDFAELDALLLPLLRTRVVWAIGFVGALYMIGEGRRYSPLKARRLLRRAARESDPLATHNLATLLSSTHAEFPRDLREAAKYYAMANKMGFDPSGGTNPLLDGSFPTQGLDKDDVDDGRDA